MRRISSLAGLLMAGMLILASSARAQPATDERAVQAKQYYENGMAHFQLEEWDQAIEEWQKGFRAKPVAQFLYNIAQAYRLSKRPERALSFYQKYLRMDPKAPNRAEVERHITSLNALLQQEKKTTTSPPVQPMPVKPAEPAEEVAAPKPAEPPRPVEPPPVTPAPAALVARAPEKPPITKRIWFWPTVAGGAAVVIAVVVVAAVVGSGGDNTKVLPLARF
jgi:tetratricopeptide (TPR) repeat protein